MKKYFNICGTLLLISFGLLCTCKNTLGEDESKVPSLLKDPNIPIVGFHLKAFIKRNTSESWATCEYCSECPDFTKPNPTTRTPKKGETSAKKFQFKYHPCPIKLEALALALQSSTEHTKEGMKYFISEFLGFYQTQVLTKRRVYSIEQQKDEDNDIEEEYDEDEEGDENQGSSRNNKPFIKAVDVTKGQLNVKTVLFDVKDFDFEAAGRKKVNEPGEMTWVDMSKKEAVAILANMTQGESNAGWTVTETSHLWPTNAMLSRLDVFNNMMDLQEVTDIG